VIPCHTCATSEHFKRQGIIRVMLKYSDEYCVYGEYCEVGDASCQSCVADAGMT